MIDYFILSGVILLALISPGPDFVMALQNALRYGRRAGLWTAAGFACGIAIHCAYCLIGIAALIQQVSWVYALLKYLGAAYLLYLAWYALRSQGFSLPENQQLGGGVRSDWLAWRDGFLTNLLNPKATLFYIALFTQFIGPDTSLLLKLMYGATGVLLTFLWFAVVAVALTLPAVRGVFLAQAKWVDRLCGLAFIGLAAKLAFSSSS